MFVSGQVLIKGVEERAGKKKDGSLATFRNVLVFGLSGSPADLTLSVDDKPELIDLAKKHVLQRVNVVIDIKSFRGMTFMVLHDIQPVPGK